MKGENTQTLFSSSDIPWHNALRRAINPFFNATASVNYEHLIDKTIDFFLEQVDARFSGKNGTEGIIDLENWLLYFSFDVIGELTYGSRHGFIESGSDHQGIIGYLNRFAGYGSVVRLFVSLRESESVNITRLVRPTSWIGFCATTLSFCGLKGRIYIMVAP